MSAVATFVLNDADVAAFQVECALKKTAALSKVHHLANVGKHIGMHGLNASSHLFLPLTWKDFIFCLYAHSVSCRQSFGY